MKKLISIIIPAYNCELTILNCIRSVEKQNYSNYEIILVNDGSTDNTDKIILKMKKENNRIKYYKHENRGVSYTRNFGISKAKGYYITFLDSDDIVFEDIYVKQIEMIEKQGTELSMLSKYTIRKMPKRYSGKFVFSSEEALKLILALNAPSSMWAYVYKKQIIEDVMLYEDLHFLEDILFNIEVINKSNNISIISGDYYSYTDINPGSLNRQSLNDRKINSLKIYERLKTIFKGDKLINRRLEMLKTHIIVSMLVNLNKDNSSFELYYQKIKKEAKKDKMKSILNFRMPLKYKLFSILYMLNFKLAYKIIQK